MKRSQFIAVTLLLAVTSSCSRSLELPDPPRPPGPGTIQGTVVYAKPGQSALAPAKGATIELLGTSAIITSNETGYFSLSPIPVTTGAVLLRFDADDDGSVDHQKLIRVEELKGGPGKDIALGPVTLGGNAIVKGAVLRADRLSAGDGHGGTSVFVPEGPFLAYSGDNGSFTFENLPEGDLTLSFFRAGYAAQQVSLSLRAGEVFTLSTVVLTAETSTPGKTRVTGLVTLFGAPASDGVAVHAGSAATATTGADGNFSFDLDPGVYVFGFEKSGFVTVSLQNVVVTGATTQLSQVILVPGTSTPANLDAGAPYNAGPAPDAGGVSNDAGSGDAGSVDSGASVDAGGGADAGGAPDAGSADAGPRAIIDAPAAFVTTSGTFVLNGSHSIGERPFVYHWLQTGGPTVTIPNNDTVLAATPSIQAPAMATVLKFTLTITDATNATSPASHEVVMPVGAPPKAVIAAGWPSTVYASQTVQLDGRPSNDPSGIIEYDWSVLPGDAGIVLSPTGDAGEFVRLTMPASVPTALVVTVKLDVVSGLLVPSAMPAVASFTLTTASAPTWVVDAGFPQVANGGSVVTINGAAFAPGIPGATFAYLWSPDREPASGTADWQLTDATAATTTFIAPVVVGPTRLINFTLTATSTSGLMPAQKQARTWVTVVDKTPPHVVATSIIAGKGSTQGMIIDFDEPIDPVAVNSVTVQAASGSPHPAPIIADRIVTGARLTLVYGSTGAVVTSSQILNVASVRDLAPGMPNTMPTVQYPFIVEARWSPAYESASSSPTEPRPGLSVQNEHRVLVFGRKANQTWFLEPIDPDSCTVAPCPVNDDATAPTASLTNTAVRGPRGQTLGGTSYALAQMKDQQGDAGIAFVNSGAGWASFTAPLGTMFADGTRLSTVYAENNSVKIARYDPSLTSWSYADAGIIVTDPVLFSTDTASDPLPIGVGSPTNATVVVARTSKSGDIRAFINPRNTTTWNAMGGLGSNGATDRVIEARTGITANYPGSGYTTFSSVSGRLRVIVYGDVNNSTDMWSSGVAGFDTVYHADALWSVASLNGQLVIKVIPYGTFTPTVFSGPQVGGVLNNDPSCTADFPEMAFVNEKVFVAWAEQCGSNPWKMYFRMLK